jgi:UDP:flavonoid glycosyltransferase YjiC (YdhE family)
LTQNFNIQKVLVAPLDWGLGHATRCIPIIRALLNNGYEVIIGAEGAQATLLQTEFPSLAILPLTGYHVRYSRQKWWLSFALLMQLPHLLKVISDEHRWLQNMIKEQNIDLVISDNRYGLYSKKVSCIFITHQLTIKAPFAWLEKILQRINYRYINRFTCCWVPDVAGDINAAGILSHPAKLPRVKVYYIGLLRDRKEKILLVRGKPGSNETITVNENITIQNHLPGLQLQEAILQSDYVISRSGYTTIMELLSLQKRSILIPTPGQTEQEYLGEKLEIKNICMTVSQDKFNFSEHIPQAKIFPYQLSALTLFDESHITDLLKNAVSYND